MHKHTTHHNLFIRTTCSRQRPTFISIKIHKTYDMQDVSTFNIRRIKIDMMNYCMHIAYCWRVRSQSRKDPKKIASLLWNLCRRRYIDNRNYDFLEYFISFNFVTSRNRIHLEIEENHASFLVLKSRNISNQIFQYFCPPAFTNIVYNFSFSWYRLHLLVVRIEFHFTSLHQFNCSVPTKFIIASSSLLFLCALIRV